MVYGIKYTKEHLEYLGIKVILTYTATSCPILIVENKEGCFVRYSASMSIDDAINKFLAELRKEKLEKLNALRN